MTMVKYAVTWLRRLAVAVAALLMTGCFLGGSQPIVYVSQEDGQGNLFLLNPENGEATQVTNHGVSDSFPRWSPDGSTVSFLRDEEQGSSVFLYEREDDTPGALVLNAGVDYPPVWSPESDALAFVSPKSGSSEIYAVGTGRDSDIRAVQQVTVNELDERLGDWHPDGAWLVFSASGSGKGKDAEPGLWLRNAQGVDQIRLTNSRDRDPRWSPDGGRIVFARVKNGNEDIYAIAPNKGGSWRQGVREIPLAVRNSADHSPVWAPDSKSIAFVSDRDGNPEIYVMRADGEKPRRLTFNDAADHSPVWSPDGKRIAFVSFVYDQGEILVMDADGSNQQRLTNNGAEDHSPDW